MPVMFFLLQHTKNTKETVTRVLKRCGQECFLIFSLRQQVPQEAAQLIQGKQAMGIVYGLTDGHQNGLPGNFPLQQVFLDLQFAFLSSQASWV